MTDWNAMSDDADVKLTSEGRRALRAGKHLGLAPAAALMGEIMLRTDHMTKWQVEELYCKLLARYGDPERALTAILRGEVAITKVQAN
jgi:hypothetical protein